MSQRTDSPLNVSRILLINALVPISALILLGILLAWQMWRVNEANVWIEHSWQVQTQVNSLSAQLKRMESAQRGFLIAERPDFEGRYRESFKNSETLLAQLPLMVADNPSQVAHARALQAQVHAWESNAARELHLKEKHDPRFLPYFTAGKGIQLMESVWSGLQDFSDVESGLLTEREELERRESALAALLGGLGLLIAIVFFALFSRRQYEMLTGVYTENTERLQGQNEELQVQSEELQVQNEELQAQSEEIQSQSEELIHQNQELALLSAKAEAANRLKSEFLANMSHELRTPLNSIIGYTELVISNKKTALEDRVRANLNVVLRNGRHLLSLINDILDLSKVEAGKSTLYAEPLDTRQVLQALMSVAEPLAQKKGLALSCQVDPGLGSVVTDETKLRQIVLNLVSNAIKFTPAGSVTVHAAPMGTDRFSISVKDTGIGIAPENQTLVFEEFRQVDASTTREIGGTGLGLAIARKLTILLGGHLTLSSAPGEGSLFTLDLPRVIPGYQPPMAQKVPAAAPVVVPPTGKLAVIVIDDDPEALHLISEKLRDTPYAAVPASSGTSGLKLARELHPYAITLDVMMPNMDGWTVLRELKADPQTADIPVLILSFVDNKILGFDLGASAYLTKPIEQTQLMGALNRFGADMGHLPGPVLVVEDDPDARELYRQILAKENVRMVEAADGKEALEAIAKELPSLVLLDLMMPRMDGFEVAAWLRANEHTRHVPVIVVTAKELTGEDFARLSEVQRVIRKGETSETLIVEDLRALLDQVRQRQEIP